MLLRVSTEGLGWLLVASKRYGDLLKPSYTLYHVNLVALDFFCLSIGWWGTSWSLGGWELHDFRRTGVFIDLSCCFDIFLPPLQQSCYHLISVLYFFVPSFFPHGRMFVRVSSHPHDTFSLISSQFPSDCFCFIQTATAGPWPVSIHSKNSIFPQILMQTIPLFSPFISYCLIPYHTNFISIFLTPHFPSILFFFPHQ